jgi:2-polyprenyl-3-methyl-5-hydroxy-6-metoxy-1,4-benzoquinol methylase
MGATIDGEKRVDHKIDPLGREIKALRNSVTWEGKRVLEVGGGEGRLARRMAELGSFVSAIDLEPSSLRSGSLSPSTGDGAHVGYCAGDGEALPFAQHAFDTVVFGWSL